MSPRKKEANILLQERSRRKILNAAFELFGKYGYSQTSAMMIAKKAKISKGLIYHYFRSKQEVLKGVFILMDEESSRLIQFGEKLPPREFLKYLIDFFVDFIIKNNKINRISIALTAQPAVIKGLRKEIEQKRDQWFKILIRGLAEMGYEDPETEAYLLGAILDGIGLGYISMEGYPLKRIQKLFMIKYDL